MAVNTIDKLQFLSFISATARNVAIEKYIAHWLATYLQGIMRRIRVRECASARVRRPHTAHSRVYCWRVSDGCQPEQRMQERFIDEQTNQRKAHWIGSWAVLPAEKKWVVLLTMGRQLLHTPTHQRSVSRVCRNVSTTRATGENTHVIFHTLQRGDWRGITTRESVRCIINRICRLTFTDVTKALKFRPHGGTEMYLLAVLLLAALHSVYTATFFFLWLWFCWF